MVDFSEIRIGTTMQQLESFVNNQTNLSDQAKGSIFNFINDEKKHGDGKITDEAELAIVKSFLADEKSGFLNKLFGKKEAEQIPVEMPHIDPKDDGVTVKQYKQFGQFVERREQEKDGITYTERIYKNSAGVTKFIHFTTSAGNILADKDADGVVDARVFCSEAGDRGLDYERYVYEDTDMDGSYDEQNFMAENGATMNYYVSERSSNDESWTPYERTETYIKDPETGKYVRKDEK